jgi:hypothetical protein
LEKNGTLPEYLKTAMKFLDMNSPDAFKIAKFDRPGQKEKFMECLNSMIRRIMNGTTRTSFAIVQEANNANKNLVEAFELSPKYSNIMSDIEEEFIRQIALFVQNP